MKALKKQTWSRTVITFLVPLFLLTLASCGTETGLTILTGAVVMGPVDAATVKVYQLNTDGSDGNLLATTQTESDGSFSVACNPSGPLRFEATIGSYTDEATGDQVQLQERHRLQAWAGDPQNNHFVGINALTTVAANKAYQYAYQYAQQNGNTYEWLKESIHDINNEVAQKFGLSDVDIITTDPADLTRSGQSLSPNSKGSKLGAALAGFTQIALDNSMTADKVPELMMNMAQDYSDGTFDGQDADGNALSLGLDITPLQAMNGFQNALQNFLGGPRNLSNMNMEQLNFQFQE